MKQLTENAVDYLIRSPEQRIPRISLIIPALNEEKNLPYVLQKIPPVVHEVLLVDGASTDRTQQVARRSASEGLRS